MRRPTFALFAALLCAPAYAAQTGVTDGQERSTVVPAYPAPPQMTAPAPVYPAAPGALPVQASALLCRPAEGADGRLMLCEPQLAAPRRGWGEGAGMLGVTLSAITLSVGIFSQNVYTWEVILPMISVMAATGALVPVVAAGSRSSRMGAGVEGVPGLRVFGWMAYVASFAVPMFMLFENQGDYLPVMIGALDATALLCHGIDALVAGQAAKTKLEPLASLEVAPYLGPVASADGRAGASLGLAGRF